jgi:transcription antitermination factor NusG
MQSWAPISETSFQQNGDPCLGCHWYAATTRSRHEKKVAQHLSEKSLECFLPLRFLVHAWKNGKANVQLPLFPGYVFVRVHQSDMLRVLQTPGVVRFVSTRGLPTKIPDKELYAIRAAVTSQTNPNLHPFMPSGHRVRIKRGPLHGVEGMLVSDKCASRVVLSVSLLMRSVSVEVAADDLEPVESIESSQEYWQASSSSRELQWNE